MANMTQIKFTIESDIVSAFKSQCASGGVSMASEVRQFMKSSKPTRDTNMNMSTRGLRRKAVLKIIAMLNDIMLAESQYRDEIPEQFAQRYDAADQAC